MADPISKTAMATKMTSFTEKTLYTVPNINWNAQVVRRYAEAYQPTASSAPNSSVILGIAVAIMILSWLY